jgi:hypothetical protein
MKSEFRGGSPTTVRRDIDRVEENRLVKKQWGERTGLFARELVEKRG